MRRLTSLSIFFPALNDANTLPTLIRKAYATGKKVADSLEVIVINDGSTDHTTLVLDRLIRKHPHLRVITHAKNMGYGSTIRHGFRTAKYAWIFYTDGDNQYDPAELVRLVQARTPTTDVVNGYKLRRSDPWIRSVLGALYNWWMHQRHPLPIRDVDCDFRLIKRSALQKIHLTSRSGAIGMELVTKLHRHGAQFAEVGVHHYPRKFGDSQFFKPKHLMQTMYELLQ